MGLTELKQQRAELPNNILLIPDNHWRVALSH
jgi:hypothetical protein